MGSYSTKCLEKAWSLSQEQNSAQDSRTEPVLRGPFKCQGQYLQIRQHFCIPQLHIICTQQTIQMNSSIRKQLNIYHNTHSLSFRHRLLNFSLIDFSSCPLISASFNTLPTALEHLERGNRWPFLPGKKSHTWSCTEIDSCFISPLSCHLQQWVLCGNNKKK